MRDQVITELVPPHENRSWILGDAVLAGLVRERLLTLPLVGSGMPPKPPPVAPYAELAREARCGPRQSVS